MMDWLLVFTHLLAVYVAFGAWLGYVWTREDNSSVALSLFLGVPLGIAVAPLALLFVRDDPDYAIPRSKKPAAIPAAARQELKRIKKIERDEEVRVVVLEMSADHRKTMAQLDARRLKAEELT